MHFRNDYCLQFALYVFTSGVDNELFYQMGTCYKMHNLFYMTVERRLRSWLTFVENIDHVHFNDSG